MLSKKGRRATKVLGYTFVIFGAVCLARVPTTNSKYITTSELNKDYLSYNTSFRQISYEKEEFPDGTTPVPSGIGTSEITFEIPRNIRNGIPNSSTTAKDVYRFAPSSTCRITNINGTNFDTRKGESLDFTYTGIENKSTKVTIVCDTTTTAEGQTDNLLFQSVELGQKSVTKATLNVYEKIGNGTTFEPEFLYRTYEEEFSSTITSAGESSTTIESSSTQPFYDFVKWIVKYSHSSDAKGNTELIKNYIQDSIVDDVKARKGASYNERYLQSYIIELYQSLNDIPAIQGINRVDNGSSITFSIDQNLIGYAKTYNYYTSVKDNSDNDAFSLYFSVPVNDDNKDLINQIFDEYIDLYIISKNDPDYDDFKKYLENQAYKILKDNRGDIPGIYRASTEEIRIQSITRLKNAAKVFYNNTFTIEATNTTNLTQFTDNFKNELAKAIVVQDMDNHDIVVDSYIHNNADYTNDNLMRLYANKGYLEGVDYDNVDRYIIYKSNTSDDKFLLVKITKETETSMRVYLADLDTAIAAQGNDGIFTYDSSKDEMYISVHTERSNVAGNDYAQDKDFGKVRTIVAKLNAALGGNYDVGEQPTPNNRQPQRFFEYKYEMINTTSVDADEEMKLENQIAPELNMGNIDNVQEATDSVSLTDNSTNKEFGIVYPNSNTNISMNIQEANKSDAKVSEYSNNKQQELAEAEKDAKTDKVVLDNNIQNDTNNTNKSGENQVPLNDSLTMTDEAQLVS